MLNLIPEFILEFLREPSWEFVIGIASLVITVWMIPRKQLVCRLEKVPQTDNTFIATIHNTGNTPIKKEDYQSPIRLSTDTAKVSTYEVITTKYSPYIFCRDNQIRIERVLFNPNDTLEIKFTTEKYINLRDIKCDAHIARMNNGVKVLFSEKNEEEWEKKQKIRKILITLALICELIAIGLILWVIYE